MDNFANIARGLLGIFLLVGLAALCSSNRRRIPWKLVAAGLVLQLAFALAVLKVPLCKEAMEGCPVEAIGNDGTQAGLAADEAEVAPAEQSPRRPA